MYNGDYLGYKSTDGRNIVDVGKVLGTNLKMVGHCRYDRAMPPLPEQKSDEWLAISLLVSGLQCYEIDGNIRVLRGGQGIRFLSGVTYSSGNFPEQRGEMVWIIVRKPDAGSFALPGLTSEAAEQWWEKVSSREHLRRFPVSLKMRENLRHMLSSLHLAPSPMSASELSMALGMVLVDVYEMVGTGIDDQISPGIARVLNWLDDHLGVDELYMDDLAKLSDLSVSRFHTRFKDEIGITPSDYLLRKKILHAQRCLLKGNSVTEVAYEFGFSSSQYFATVFKRYTLMTPSAWVRSQRQGHLQSV